MNSLRQLRLIRLLLVGSLLCFALPPPAMSGEASPTNAQPATAPQAPPATADVHASLQEARESIKNGDYDHAIEILQGMIAQAGNRLTDLREAYLLLIETHVFLGNDLKFKPQGRQASVLSYKAAKEKIAECLRIKELRHTRPEPASDFPPELVSFFAEVRGEIFGSFRVAQLEPSDATVVLDADTLRAPPGENALGDVDLPVGRHLVVVRRHGYKNATDEIEVSAGSTLQQSYRLSKRRGAAWYATWGAGALAVTGGLVALVAGKGSGSSASAPQPLPAAPPPPSR